MLGTANRRDCRRGSRVDRFPLSSSLMLVCPRCQPLAGERARAHPTA